MHTTSSILENTIKKKWYRLQIFCKIHGKAQRIKTRGVYMITIWDLENELTYGNFNTPAAQTVDAFKVEAAFKILTAEVQRLSTVEISLTTLQLDLTTMSEKYEEILSVVRKIGKDYPEVVLVTPHLFAQEENEVRTV